MNTKMSVYKKSDWLIPDKLIMGGNPGEHLDDVLDQRR